MNTPDRWISLTTVVWLFPVAFMCHDLEEIVFVERFLRRNGDRIRRRVPAPLVGAFERRAHMRTDEFAVAVGAMLVLVSLVSVVGARAVGRGLAAPVFVAAVFVFLLHALVHTAQSVVLRAYTPGVVTSWLVVIPYSAYALWRFDQASLYRPSMLWLALPLAAIAVATVALGQRAGMVVGRRARHG